MMNDIANTDSPRLLRADAAGIATLTLNRPAQYNAIDSAMLDDLHAALGEISADKRVRVVVIEGAGKAFSPGHDLKEMLANSHESFVADLFRRCCDVMLAIQRIPQPVIAKVHGFATSGINFGLFCATPGVAVSRDISRKRAFEMLFTGDFIDAQTALSWGLVNRVVPLDQLDAATNALAASLIDKPSRVVALGKRFFYEQLEERIDIAYKIAAATITHNMLGEDAQEGVAAFVEKRKPHWDD